MRLDIWTSESGALESPVSEGQQHGCTFVMTSPQASALSLPHWQVPAHAQAHKAVWLCHATLAPQLLLRPILSEHLLWEDIALFWRCSWYHMFALMGLVFGGGGGAASKQGAPQTAIKTKQEVNKGAAQGLPGLRLIIVCRWSGSAPPMREHLIRDQEEYDYPEEELSRWRNQHVQHSGARTAAAAASDSVAGDRREEECDR